MTKPGIDVHAAGVTVKIVFTVLEIFKCLLQLFFSWCHQTHL